MDLNALIRLLQKEGKIHEKILLAKREEQRYLATADVNLLLKNTVLLNDLVEEARQMEERRRTLLEDCALQLGISKPNPTLRDLLEKMPTANRMEMEEVGDHLRNMVLELKDLNHANQLILQRSVEVMHNEISYLIQTQESGVYTSKGAKDSRVVPRAGLNLRA